MIGKGGKTCKQLREQTLAQIVVSSSGKDNRAPERILTITGSVEAVSLALALSSQRILQGKDSNPAPPPEATLSLRLLVPNVRMGGLIGKQGLSRS